MLGGLLGQSQALLANSGYNRNFVGLLEMVYGVGYLSQGGWEDVKLLFDGVQLSGQKVLDVGCGVGGPALDLAREYNVQILGVDPESWIVMEAKNRLEAVKEPLRGRVSFALMPDPLSFMQFAPAEFDIIISKEAILHVPIESKLAYFKEVFRILKPGGSLIIKDWVCSRPFTDQTKQMMTDAGVPFNLISFDQYQELLGQAGFEKLQVFDETYQYIKYCDQNIQTVQDKKEDIIKKFGEKVFENTSVGGWNPYKQAFVNREIQVMKIVTRR